ncbi:MAG: patatin-like phospholipase family protein [Haloechinothrix sp.]
MDSEISPPDSEHSSTHALLSLQRAESSLVRADLSAPGAPASEIRALRYLLGFARLTVFQPGAALDGHPTDRTDVDVAAEVEPFRARVLTELADPIRQESDPERGIRVALDALARLADPLREVRGEVLRRHANDFTATELDAECGHKRLVIVGGGGGGAGWVYVGAFRRLDQAGITPSYIIGSSMGALIGLLRSRSVEIDWSHYIALAHGLDRRNLFSPISIKRKHGLPGLLSLTLSSSIGHLFTHEDGTPVRVNQLAIPYEGVVAGVRRAAFDRLPRRFRATAASVMRRAAPLARYSARSLAPAIATRMWQVAAFFDPRVVKPIIFGADPLTAECNVVDVAGFSAAIPGVLHYDIADDDVRMHDLLRELADGEHISALVDGGVASNVPAEQAWRRVHAGKLGTRNAFVLAWDCFHPQWDPRHLWLQPITQAVALQQVRNAPFAVPVPTPPLPFPTPTLPFPTPTLPVPTPTLPVPTPTLPVQRW